VSPAWLDGLAAPERDRVGRAAMPKGADLMKATLTHEPFSDPDWVYERKLDGERVLAVKQGEDVRLLTRNDKDAGAPYPEIAEALATQSVGALAVDGEVVAFEGRVTSFSRLQKRMQKRDPEEARASGVAVYYYAFDILNLEGYDVTALPLRRRKALLRGALAFGGPLRFTPHRREGGEAYLKEACEKGWEGLIAKRAEAPYVAARSRDWLKFKCTRGQELVIGGFTEPQGSRQGFGALLVGYHEGERLRYAGKVGTGYDDETLADLRRRMDKLERQTSPFDEPVKESGAHFVTPALVGEFGFTEWTEDGKLRHPRFLGLRRDKPAREVVREEGGAR
jgi:bifunctional non-homologous end joining protein LigD